MQERAVGGECERWREQARKRGSTREVKRPRMNRGFVDRVRQFFVSIRNLLRDRQEETRKKSSEVNFCSERSITLLFLYLPCSFCFCRI